MGIIYLRNYSILEGLLNHKVAHKIEIFKKALYKKILGICVSYLIAINIHAEPLADTLIKIKPSIVGVGTFMPSRSPRSIFSGTGFAIENGQYIVTNAHVVGKSLNAERLEQHAIFITRNQTTQMAIVEKIATDKKHDIAILKLKKGTLPALQLGGASDVREGNQYAFTGYPIGMILGLYPVTHQGIISAISPIAIPVINSRSLNSRVIDRLQAPYDVYQLDATAYPGNSGSPLYKTGNGKVVGVINKVFVKETKESLLSKPSGITYAIPIKYVKQLLMNTGVKKNQTTQ